MRSARYSVRAARKPPVEIVASPVKDSVLKRHPNDQKCHAHRSCEEPINRYQLAGACVHASSNTFALGRRAVHAKPKPGWARRIPYRNGQNDDTRSSDPLHVGSKKPQRPGQGLHVDDRQSGRGEAGHALKEPVDERRHRQECDRTLASANRG